MAKRLASYPEFVDLSQKLKEQLTHMMTLDCMDCKARLYHEILETVSDIIIFVKQEAENNGN